MTRRDWILYTAAMACVVTILYAELWALVYG